MELVQKTVHVIADVCIFNEKICFGTEAIVCCLLLEKFHCTSTEHIKESLYKAYTFYIKTISFFELMIFNKKFDFGLYGILRVLIDVHKVKADSG